MVEWNQVRIMDVIEPLTTIDPRKHPDESIEYIDVSSVSRDTFSIQNTVTLNGHDAPSRARRLVHTGDVLFATIRPTLQRIALVPEYLDGAVCSTGYFVLRPKAEVFGRYLFHYLFSQPFSDEMASLQRGASYPAVSDRDVKEHFMILPPLAEQRRMVAILDEAFAGIGKAVAHAEKNRTNARELFESHLNAIFTQKGEGWVEEKLGECCTFSSGGTPSKKKKAYWEGDIPWVSGRDMKSDRLADTALHISENAVVESATRIAPVGSLLILVRGMGLANGVAMAEMMSPCAFNQDIRAIHPTENIIPRFLLLALKSTFARSDKLLSNAAHGTLKIDMDGLREVSVPIPSIDIQKRIAAQIDSMSESNEQLESLYTHKLDKLAELKQSILAKAFSGELTGDSNRTEHELVESI